MLDGAIPRLKQWGVNLYLRLKEKLLNTNSKGFEGLNPYIEKDRRKHREDVYTKALEKALSDPQIKNIAITGGFGAGKSSFLRSFEYHHKKWNYLFISLATFRDKKGDENNQLIERSILQQLFYKVKKKDIPSSRYARLQSLDFWDDSNPLVIIIIWLASLVVIFKPETAQKFFDFSTLCDSAGSWCGISIRAIFAITSYLIAWKVYKYLSNFRVTDLNSKGGFTVSEESKDSLLNEQIDEILYFFEAAEYDVVVIEDLDRSNNQEIFIKLREINELINKSDQVKQNVNFVYAIKDEIFQEEATRTKFFDFMIPIIPYIHHSNSYSKLKDKLPKYNNDKDFQSLLRIVSEYIFDMRLLINIVNEFKMYSEKVKFNDSSKLFAMIVYKNMYPSDFSKLHKNEGVLATIFNSETAYRQKAMLHLNSEISSLKNEIDSINKQEEWVSEIADLKSLYVLAAIKKYGDYIYIDGNQVNFQLKRNTNTDTIFEALKKAKKISLDYTGSNGISFSELGTEVFSEASYREREDFITGKAKEHIEVKKQKIEEFTAQKKIIENHTLKELLEVNSVNTEFVENTKAIEKSKKVEKVIEGKTGKELEEDKTDEELEKAKSISSRLFRLLIREGHIDKHFRTYISYFHEGKITEQDHQFLLDVRDQTPLDANYTLQNPKEVIDDLDVRYFKHPSILNFNLFDEVVKRTEKIDAEKIKFLFGLLKSNDEDANKFIGQYFEYTPNKEEFIKLLVKKYPLFWGYIYNDSDYSKKKKDEYLAVIIRSSKVGDIVELNKNETLEIYIEGKEDFIEFCENEKLDQNKIQQLLKELKIKFPSLNFKEAENPFSELIYNNNFYEISPSMLNSIIECFSGVHITPEIEEDLETSHYTTIKEMESEGLEPLLKYIRNEIDDFVRSVILTLERNTQESEATVIELLNAEDVDENLCKKIMLKEEVKITDITTIEYRVLWPLLLDNNSVVPHWDNMLHFYNHEEEKKKKKEEESSDE